jgi:predicted GIY-YIG superfamily endonuclease
LRMCIKKTREMSLGLGSFLFACSMSLLGHLKEFRQTRSLAEKIPLYCVFGDTVMRSISQTRPMSLQALQTIRGFSDDKCVKYGEDIIQIIRKSSDNGGNSSSDSGVGGVIPQVIMRYGRSGKSSLFRKRKSAVPYVRPVDTSRVNTCAQRIQGIPLGKEGVYILELSQGRVYVGHSSDTRRRMHQHLSGQGSAFTKAFPPTGVVLPRLGCVSGSSEAAERDETLRYMFLRGIQFVRGWKYTRIEMSDEEVQDAEENIRELFDLCRRCGHPGHFITNCRANFDRLGRPCSRR